MRLLLLLCLWLPLATAQLGARFTKQVMQRMIEGTRKSRASHSARDTDPSLLYPERRFQMPVDHFPNDSRYEPHSNETFALRYWFDAQYYKPGGPVFIMNGGEVEAPPRLRYMVKGIAQKVAKATNGISVLLEHRYYGDSIPTKSFSTKDLRFLTTEQALADEAYFSRNIVFPGLESHNLTSHTTPHIAYGGSYAGSLAAFLRLLYPDTFWGAISSSGVPEAIYDFWQYYSGIAEYGPRACVETQQKIIDIVDNIIIRSNSSELVAELKSVFGLPDITDIRDFASKISAGMDSWQDINWDPEISGQDFFNYCDTITSKTADNSTDPGLRKRVSDLIEAAGYAPDADLVTSMLNFIGTLTHDIDLCSMLNKTQDECFSFSTRYDFNADDLDQTWRAWPYQFCDEWGFLPTGSGVPADIKPLISRVIDMPYNSLICKYAFNRTTPPDVDRIKKYGGYNISYPRLAWIDGERDPWRAAGPHAFKQGAKNRESTTSEPFILIHGGIHHWDSNGVFPNKTDSTFPPQFIRDVQDKEIQFVKAWLREWDEHKLMVGQ